MNHYLKNPDLLTPAESRNENRFLGKVLVLWILGFVMFWLGYNYAGACGYEEPEQIKITWIAP